VVARADAVLALEGDAQRERRGVADLAGDGGQREPPAGQERVDASGTPGPAVTVPT
jgi:hypothetical protein